MKKIFIAIIIFVALSFTIKSTLNLKFTEDQLNKHWQKLNIIKNIVDQSDLPHGQVKFIILSIDSLQMDIQRQVSDTILNPKKP